MGGIDMSVSPMDIEVMLSPTRTQYLRVLVYDKLGNYCGSLQTYLTGGSTTVNSNSDIRKTFSIEALALNNSLKPPTSMNFSNKLVWMDKLLNFQIGLKAPVYWQSVTDILWYNQGWGIIDAPSWKYDATTNSVSFEAVDLVATLNGNRGGYLPGIPVTIPQGSNVKEAIIGILTNFANIPIDKMNISECYNKDKTRIISVPTDLIFDQGSTVWDVLVGLRDIMPNYQMYFDNDAVFHYEPVPYETNPEIYLSDGVWQKTMISEVANIDYGEVYNYIEVYGQTQNVGAYGEYGGEATYQYTQTQTFRDIYNDDIMVTAPVHYLTLDTWPSNQSEQTQKIMDGTIPVMLLEIKEIMTRGNNFYLAVNGCSPFGVVTVYEGEYWGESVMQAPENVGKVYVIAVGESGISTTGAVQHYGEAKDTNPNSPFNINSSVGIVRKVFSGGEFDNIYSDELCKERAEWELYQHCRLVDRITIVTVPNFLLDVNKIVKYTSKQTGETHEYLITAYNTDWNIDGTTNLTLQRYYPYYQ